MIMHSIPELMNHFGWIRVARPPVADAPNAAMPIGKQWIAVEIADQP
jgi:hypothetical protein